MISTEFHLNDGEKKLQRDVKGMFYLLNRAEHFGDEKPNGLFFLVFFFPVTVRERIASVDLIKTLNSKKWSTRNFSP